MRTMGFGVSVVLFMLANIPGLAGAAHFTPALPLQTAASKAADPQADALTAALRSMQQGRAAEASAAVDPILAAYERQYASEKRQIYCGVTPVQTLLYLTTAASIRKSAVAIDPGWCVALFLKGFSLVDQKQVAAGLPFLERAVAFAPSNSHYLNELAYAYQALRRWPEALATYDRAASSSSLAIEAEQKMEQARAWRGSGYVLVEQGKWDEAAAYYRKCLKLDPGDEKAKGELRYIDQNRPRQS